MEKMFVNPEAVESSVGMEGTNDRERAQSRTGIVAYKARLYRTLLKQSVATQLAPAIEHVLFKNAQVHHDF